MGTTPNASRADIIAMLRDGHSNSRIVRELHVDKQRVRRIRHELGLPAFVPVEQTRTIEEKWALFTRPVDGCHMQWTGTRGTASGTPVLSYKEQVYTAASIAFRIRTGREPQGYAIPDCGRKHCVAPDHVNDEAGRRQARRRVRAERGLGEPPATCGRGHDQTEDGRLEADGTAYCEGCKVEDKRRQRDPELPAPQGRRPRSLEEAFRQRITPLDDGHVGWVGSRAQVTPTMWWNGTVLSAYKIAFRLHYGREPEGIVRSICAIPVCVAGPCLADRRLRAANQRADLAFEAIFGGAA
jgi:hypothetical protein